LELLSRLFDPTGFVPRALCGQWTPSLIRLHSISDFLIWAAYLTIPVVLMRFAYWRRHELPFRHLLWLFALFLLSSPRRVGASTVMLSRITGELGD
jgi:hypothetical protein